jgi:MFS family permease
MSFLAPQVAAGEYGYHRTTMGRSQRKEAARARRDRERGNARRRATWITLSLATVLSLQLWSSWGKFGLPFLDTRLHYNYDNAEFTFRARCGNRNGDLRSQFGVTANAYSRWGERSGEPWYYTDHPFLVKALFQQYTKIVSTEEWASRAFYFAVSFAIATGLYTLLLQTTGSLLASLAGAATLVSLPLFAVYQTCVKFETDGMLVSVWLFVALTAYLREGKRRALAVYGILTAVAFLVHWTAALFVGAVGTYLLIASWRGKDPTPKRALAVTVSAGILGIGLLVASMSYIQRGWHAAWGHLARAFAVRSAPIPAGTWWARQWSFSKANFTGLFPWLVVGLSLFLAGRWCWSTYAQRKPPTQPLWSARLLVLFVLSTLTVACVWLFSFPQGSFIHKYWQYWFCLAIAALVAAFLASVRTTVFGFAAGTVACCGLVIYLFSAARASYAGVLGEQLGTTEDIVFLSSLREDRFSRMVFVPVSETPLNQWFDGPLFEYYTDRRVVTAASGGDLHVGDKVLVLRYRQRGDVIAALSDWSHKALVSEKCGSRLCAYDVADR